MRFRLVACHIQSVVEFVALDSGDPTSASLLCRALAHEPDAWTRLVALYSPLVQHWCRQSGILDQDIADVSQEVFAAVSSSLARYQPDQPGTSFRGWMRGIARHKLLHHANRRGLPAMGGSEALKRLNEVPAPDAEFELSESPDDVNSLYQRALRQVQLRFEERSWTAFWLVTVENRTTSDVAVELGISPNAVRLAKSHVLRQLREEMGELIA